MPKTSARMFRVRLIHKSNLSHDEFESVRGVPPLVQWRWPVAGGVSGEMSGGQRGVGGVLNPNIL